MRNINYSPTFVKDIDNNLVEKNGSDKKSNCNMDTRDNVIVVNRKDSDDKYITHKDENLNVECYQRDTQNDEDDEEEEVILDEDIDESSSKEVHMRAWVEGFSDKEKERDSISEKEAFPHR